jgi:hypothetical protein
LAQRSSDWFIIINIFNTGNELPVQQTKNPVVGLDVVPILAQGIPESRS